jgi:hypothetical protein
MMTLDKAVSLIRRAILWRSLRNRLLVDLGWLGMLFAVVALVDRLVPLAGTSWSGLLLIGTVLVLARLFWCARNIQLERTSMLLLADDALGSPETLVTADELSQQESLEDVKAMQTVVGAAEALLAQASTHARLRRLGPVWPSSSWMRLAMPLLALGVMQFPARIPAEPTALVKDQVAITPVKAVAEVVEEAIESASAFGEEDGDLAAELAESLTEAATADDPLRQAEAMAEARRQLDERLESLQAESDALKDRLAELNPKLDPATSLREALQEGNEALAEQAAAELDAQLAQAMADGDEVQAEAIRKALSDLASDLSDVAMTTNKNPSTVPEASQEMLDMMAQAAAGDQKAQERLKQMAEQLKQASENKDGQRSGDATAMMKQLMQAMKEGQAMQSACGSMSPEEAMAALSGMAQCEEGTPGLGNKSKGKSNGGLPGSAQETESDTTFERLAGDPSEGEVLLRMKERRAAPVGESTLDPVEARRVALAGWEAALEQEVTDPRHREALRRYHERLTGKKSE